MFNGITLAWPQFAEKADENVEFVKKSKSLGFFKSFSLLYHEGLKLMTRKRRKRVGKISKSVSSFRRFNTKGEYKKLPVSRSNYPTIQSTRKINKSVFSFSSTKAEKKEEVELIGKFNQNPHKFSIISDEEDDEETEIDLSFDPVQSDDENENENEDEDDDDDIADATDDDDDDDKGKEALRSTVVLENISFGVRRGSLVVVVGATGSGKSTLLSGLLGECQVI